MSPQNWCLRLQTVLNAHYSHASISQVEGFCPMTRGILSGGSSPGGILSVFRIGDLLYFTTPLPDCLCHVSFRTYSPLSLEVVEKRNKCKSFLAPNFWEGRPRLFYGRLLARFNVHRLSKFR